MVPQDFQNLALGDAVTVALGDHALQFLLESLQALDPLFDLTELSPRDGVRLSTGLTGVVRQVPEAP